MEYQRRKKRKKIRTTKRRYCKIRRALSTKSGCHVLFSTRVVSTSMSMYSNDNTSAQQAGKYEDSISAHSPFKQDRTSSALLLDILFKVHLKKQLLLHCLVTGGTKTRNLHLCCRKFKKLPRDT